MASCHHPRRICRINLLWRLLAANQHISLRIRNLYNAGRLPVISVIVHQKDGWFAGFTAYYTTAVWVGCDMRDTAGT